MVYSLLYRRPPHVDSARSSLNGDAKPKSFVGSMRSVSTNSSTKANGIPDALSFDRIISGGTCPVSQPHKFPIGAIELCSTAMPFASYEALEDTIPA